MLTVQELQQRLETLLANDWEVPVGQADFPRMRSLTECSQSIKPPGSDTSIQALLLFFTWFYAEEISAGTISKRTLMQCVDRAARELNIRKGSAEDIGVRMLVHFAFGHVHPPLGTPVSEPHHP
jgi:hypothetical protein